ncbi:MAG: prephenate dehydrogenase/arogenate dehydrogenase family protein [Acidimicrobiia bacterium]
MTLDTQLNSFSRSVGIVGAGLIGGSIALGLRKAGWRVIGFDLDPDVMSVARDRTFFDEVASDIDALIARAPDLLVIAAPPTATVDLVGSIRTDIPTMDVAGVKVPVLEVAVHLPRFIGTHPMAGRETSGPTAASAALFKGATWVVVGGGDAGAEQLVTSAVADLGARVVNMTARDHDVAVAAISHLPHLVAGALLSGALETPVALELAAGSFRDLTRVGASAPIPWVELLKTNQKPVLAAIEMLRDELATLEDAIVAQDDTLLTLLSRSRDTRRSLGAPVAQVRVALADEPGELAKVGHAFEESGVDIRDIQMRHAPYGGGGVLTLSVRPGDEASLRDALMAQGLLLVA